MNNFYDKRKSGATIRQWMRVIAAHRNVGMGVTVSAARCELMSAQLWVCSSSASVFLAVVMLYSIAGRRQCDDCGIIRQFWWLGYVMDWTEEVMGLWVEVLMEENNNPVGSEANVLLLPCPIQTPGIFGGTSKTEHCHGRTKNISNHFIGSDRRLDNNEYRTRSQTSQREQKLPRKPQSASSIAYHVTRLWRCVIAQWLSLTAADHPEMPLILFGQ